MDNIEVYFRELGNVDDYKALDLSKKLFNHVDNNISEQTPTEDVVEKVDGLSLNYQELIF